MEECKGLQAGKRARTEPPKPDNKFGTMHFGIRDFGKCAKPKFVKEGRRDV